MADIIQLEIELNNTIMSVHQRREPVHRAKAAAAAIDLLQRKLDELANIRREAVAEAVLRPNMSMAKVAVELNLSKSTVAKLAGPAVREVVATDMVARLDGSYTPPTAAGQSVRS